MLIREEKRISMPYKKLKLALISVGLIFNLNTFSDDSHEVLAESSSAVLEGQDGCVINKNADSESDEDSESGKSSKDKENSDDSSDIPNKENIKKGYEYLHDKYGVSGEMMAGIFGNWMQESRINEKSVEGISGRTPTEKEMKDAEKRHDDYHTGLGLGQWSYERNDMLVDHAKKMKKDWWDIEAQLDFMVTDDSGAEKFKDIASSSTEDVKENANEFHDVWEAGGNEAYINGRDPSMKDREKNAEKIWEYMKKNGMDGKKDESKIKKIAKDSKAPKGESSATNKGEVTDSNPCASNSGGDDNSGSKGTGEIGESTKKNGKKGHTIGSNYKYEDLPGKYKKYVKLPKFDKKYLDKPGNPYLGGNEGQCTELTWAYMWQLWGKRQAQGDTSPNEDGNGDVIWKSYKNHGAKITDKPTVGYGFSSKPPYANASASPPGHTGVVAGVMPDGRFIIAQYNVNPHPAKSRVVLYSVIEGTDGEMKFFSGVKGSKDPSKDKGKKK